MTPSKLDIEVINLAQYDREARRVIEPLKAEVESLRARVRELEAKGERSKVDKATAEKMIHDLWAGTLNIELRPELYQEAKRKLIDALTHPPVVETPAKPQGDAEFTQAVDLLRTLRQQAREDMGSGKSMSPVYVRSWVENILGHLEAARVPPKATQWTKGPPTEVAWYKVRGSGFLTCVEAIELAGMIFPRDGIDWLGYEDCEFQKIDMYSGPENPLHDQANMQSKQGDPLHDYIMRADPEDIKQMCDAIGTTPEAESKWVGDITKKNLDAQDTPREPAPGGTGDKGDKVRGAVEIIKAAKRIERCKRGVFYYTRDGRIWGPPMTDGLCGDSLDLICEIPQPKGTGAPQ